MACKLCGSKDGGENGICSACYEDVCDFEEIADPGELDQLERELWRQREE